MGSQMISHNYLQEHPKDKMHKLMQGVWEWSTPFWTYAHNVHVTGLARICDRSQLTVRTKDFRRQYMNQSRREHSIQWMLPWLQQVDCIDNHIKNLRAQIVSSLNTISNKETKACGRILGYMIQLWMKSPCPSPHCSTFFRRPARLCFHCIGHADNRNGKHTTGKGRKQLHTSVAKPGLLSDK